VTSNLYAAQELPRVWQMPVVAEDYDRSPLAQEEWSALEYFASCDPKRGNARESVAARATLSRLLRPISDVYYIRHPQRKNQIRNVELAALRFFMRREMYQRGKTFWEWTPAEWIEILCPTLTLFYERYGKHSRFRAVIMDAAYLLGGVTDLWPIGEGLNITVAADAYFGKELTALQCGRIFDAIVAKGYQDGKLSFNRLRQCLDMLFILNRSPYLENITGETLTLLNVKAHRIMRQSCKKIRTGLECLNILSSSHEEDSAKRHDFASDGLAQEWYEWCMAWYERAADLSPRVRERYALCILSVGRWLYQHVAEVRTPEQWTEDLALQFRSALCTWTMGQYGNDKAKKVIGSKNRLDTPLQAQGMANYLAALRRYFTDLTRRPHAVGGKPARKLRIDFIPGEVLSLPNHLKQILDKVAPRDIDLRVWARLAIAAATLSTDDLPQNTGYPLSFYRALGLVWVTSARRPNEIARLRLDCIREDWEPDMVDDDDQPVERLISIDRTAQQVQAKDEKKIPKICYLNIPSGKRRGPFWIWIPDYVADEINVWKSERPPGQRELLDRKDHQKVDYLFCYRDVRVGNKFINESLIPVLCTKAGVSINDAKGRITGHRGRSTRLTLLRRNGVGLDDLAEYAGHKDTKTIRRYLGETQLQLYHIIKDADDVSRIIEGVIDVQVASQGLPALRWFIGYNSDGEPEYCANQIYHTCPHRLECVKCGMFIGGEKARLLHEGENTLPIESKVPMNPVEKCVVDGDQAGAEACRAALQDVPAPEAPDLTLIFNPEGLSNHELEKLAQLATVEALDKLRQALDAHTKRLAEVQQHKTGRSALIGAPKKRISLIQKLIAECEQRMRQIPGDTAI
jgi:integrase